MIKLKLIGSVKNHIKKARFGNFTNEVSEIIVSKKFSKALTGIEEYSHIIIVYWMNKVKGLDILDRTPIIDIKPYWPQYDRVVGGKIPAWVNKLAF